MGLFNYSYHPRADCKIYDNIFLSLVAFERPLCFVKLALQFSSSSVHFRFDPSVPLMHSQWMCLFDTV